MSSFTFGDKDDVCSVEIFLTFHGAEDWSRINCSSAGAAGGVGGLET